MPARAYLRAVSEFRGEFPDVPIAAGVDPLTLEGGDPEPFYVTLPIVPEVGAVSASGLLYDDDLVAAIETQINAKRPGGGFGHLTEDERDVAFPHPEAFWVGAKRVGDALWAKAYVPPGAGREHLRRLKALGAAISTSIFGRGEFEKVRAGVERLLDFELETVDFAPPERAALGYGAPVVVTAQMREERNMPNDPQPQHDPKPQPARAVELRDVPDAVRAQIVAEYEQQEGPKRKVTELEQSLAARAAEVAELQKQLAAGRVQEMRRTLNGRISELTRWGQDDPAAEALRRTLRDRVLAQIDESADEATVTRVADRVFAEMKPLVETVRDKLAGPGAFVAGHAGSHSTGRQAIDRAKLAEQAGDLRKEHGI